MRFGGGWTSPSLSENMTGCLEKNIPGDSSRGLFHLRSLEVTIRHWKGSCFHHPKKITKNCQVCIIILHERIPLMCIHFFWETFSWKKNTTHLLIHHWQRLDGKNPLDAFRMLSAQDVWSDKPRVHHQNTLFVIIRRVPQEETPANGLPMGSLFCAWVLLQRLEPWIWKLPGDSSRDLLIS